MIMPYLNFTGDCEAAFKLYAEVFGGTLQHMVKYGQMPENPAFPIAEEQKDKVMHAQLLLTEAGGVSGADAVWPVEQGGTVSIQAHMQSEAEARRVFEGLAEGGEVMSPLMPNPPPDDAGLSGMLRDRFGFTWVISAMRDA